MRARRALRFTPRATTTGWRVWDTKTKRFAPGFGAKMYDSEEACRTTCERLNTL